MRWLADIHAERRQWKQIREGARRSRGYTKVYIFAQVVASNMAFGVLFKPAEVWAPHLYNLDRNSDYRGLWGWNKMPCWKHWIYKWWCPLLITEFCKLDVKPKTIPEKPYFLLDLPIKSKQGPIWYSQNPLHMDNNLANTRH